MPLVSVVIPVYNHAHTLGMCLGTLVWQARNQDLQVIIVNDGSTDNFHEELKKVLNTTPDMAALKPLVIDQENKGAPSARNRGAQIATGEYVIFLDADTFCYPDMIKMMREALEQNSMASYAYSQFRFGWKKIKSHEFDPGLLIKVNYVDTTSLIRRSDLAPFDESLERFQDWDLWLTMLEQNKIGIFVPKVLFRKIVRGRKGYSNWLPSFFYRLPWRTKSVEEYEDAKRVVLQKHHLI